MPERFNPSIRSILDEASKSPESLEDIIRFLLKVEAYEYGSTLETKRQVAEALKLLTVPESLRDEVELYTLYLKRYERTQPLFDPTCITHENGYYIGGIPLFDAHGTYIFRPNYSGEIIGRSGKHYEVRCFPNSVEIKNKGRITQMSDIPGYFKLKKDDWYAQAIVEKESPDGSKKDHNIFFGRLLQYLTDTYPFAMGPITHFRAEWGRGTNHDTYEEYRTQLEEIAKPFYTFPSNVDELGKQLTPYIQGTPLMGINLESYFRELRAIELQRRKQKIEAGWDYDLDPQVIHHNAVLKFCAEIAAWKTPTGKALQTKLGFSHMHSFPLLMFSRDVSVALERERRLKTLESLTP